MKITCKKNGLVTKEFKDLAPGSIFKVKGSRTFYLKKTRVYEIATAENAISLYDYEDYYIALSAICTVYDAELIITPRNEEK